MGKKRYNAGDFFIIPLDQNQKGYGRIIGMHKGLKVPAIEYYKVNPKQNYTIEELLNTEYLKRILCVDKPITSGKWEIIGNSPIDHTDHIFWQFHFHFEKHLIIDDQGDFVKVVSENEIKPEWVEYSICNEEGLIQKYMHHLNKDKEVLS